MFNEQDQVTIIRTGLLSPLDYDYQLYQPDEIHIKIAAKQIIADMHNPRKAARETATIEMAPKKKNTICSSQRGRRRLGLARRPGLLVVEDTNFDSGAWSTRLGVYGNVALFRKTSRIRKMLSYQSPFFMTPILMMLGVPQVLGIA